MKKFKIFLGTLFGAGLLPGAPGTWGSLATLPIIWLAWLASPVYGVILLTLIFCALSIWTAPAAVEAYGDDPSSFVMDEAAGQSVVFLFVTFTTGTAGTLALLFGGFILFRIFDILKPFGIKRMEKISGKFGILLDDLLAGVYAWVCLQTISGLLATLSG